VAGDSAQKIVSAPNKPGWTKMKFTIFLAALLTALFCWVAPSRAGTTPAYVIGLEDREILEAYKNGDTQRLNSFFHRWELQSWEISEAELELYPREVKTVYEMFEVFYAEHRKQIEKKMAAQQTAQAKSQSKGRESSRPKAAEKQEYLVIQNEIRLVVLANDAYESRKRSLGFAYPGMWELRNFRPRISSRMGRKVIYLDKSHNRALNYFFNETDGDSDTCRDYDKNKEAFLTEKILLHHRHWQRGYHYVSFPQVYMVVLNSDLDKAYIRYRDRWNEGGSLECQKRESTWKIGKIDGMWIE